MSDVLPPWCADSHTTALWIEQLGLHKARRRKPLAADTDVDVAIVGGGFSGLWTAYYLCRLDPALRIQVIEREFCGFGASGRNGGWAVGELAGSVDKYAARSTHGEALRQLRATFDAVDEIGRVTKAEGIDCGYAKGGWIRVARNTPQLQRQRAEIAHDRKSGLTEDEVRLLDPAEARDHLNATNVKGGIFYAPCAAVDPARLVHGLARVVEAAGVAIAEDTAVTEIGERRVVTDRGVVRADVVVRATEAYTRDLPGERRTLLPIYSLMVATEPLDEAIFDEIGLRTRPTFSDDRYMVIYGQRTEDNRLAFGGRGVPYLFGSKIDRRAELNAPSHELIRQTLVDLLPVLRNTEFTHRWGGVLGAPRNWMPSLHLDRVRGLGVLGGYVGEGVAAANLAGRTMAELIVGTDSDRVSLPWVGLTSRKWEPEPLRFAGVRGSRAVLATADDRESKTDKEAKLAFRLAQLLRG